MAATDLAASSSLTGAGVVSVCALLFTVGHRKGWRRLLTFTLRVANITDPDRYTVYNNTPVELTKEDQKRADAALLELLNEQGDESAPDGERGRKPPKEEGDLGTSR